VGARSLPRLSRVSGEPLWRQVAQALRADILKGVYRVGEQMPSEDDMAARFAVSRHTIREALRQLRADGLVSSRRGSGTTVMPPPVDSAFNVHRVASVDELIAYASESRYEIDRTDIVDSSAIPEDELPLPEAGQWLRLQGYRRHNDAPAGQLVCWTEVYVAMEYAGVERLLPRMRGPIWQLIEDTYGERLIEIEQTLRVRRVPPDIAPSLCVDDDAVVVEVRRTYRTSTGKVAEVSVNLYPADKFRFDMKLRRA
jgi:GntR family transcriptional regulator